MVIRVVETEKGAIITTKVVGEQRDRYGASWTWRRNAPLTDSQWASLRKQVEGKGRWKESTFVVSGDKDYAQGGLLGPELEISDGSRYRLFIGAESWPPSPEGQSPTWLTDAVAAMRKYAQCE